MLALVALEVHWVESSAASAVQARVQGGYGKLPLSFEANQGQTDTQVQFLSRGSGYSLFLTPTEAVLALRQTAKSASRWTPPRGRHSVHLENPGLYGSF